MTEGGTDISNQQCAMHTVQIRIVHDDDNYIATVVFVPKLLVWNNYTEKQKSTDRYGR